MRKVTRNDIINLALNNPELYTSLEFWRQGYCTFEEALMACIVVLVDSNNSLFKSLTTMRDEDAMNHIARHTTGAGAGERDD